MYGNQVHAGGEPTRAVVSGGPNLGPGSIAGRLAVFQEKFDHLRSALICEPRGSDVMIAALFCPP